MTHKKTMFATIIAALLVSFFLARVISNFSSHSKAVYKRLSEENLALTDVERKPSFSAASSSMNGGGAYFVLYQDGFAVWKNKRSPTGYCSAAIPENLRKEIMDLAKRSASGLRYDLVAATDQTMYTFQYGATETNIYGNLDHDPFSPWFVTA